ncbi:MAG: right-handed parallel beta-helix repeat-containing protein [Bacteroidaceae bacterium]|nr:right-handed parallel beta-helix repeat-containing protein [Bacteroidaceae bacterium]
MKNKKRYALLTLTLTLTLFTQADTLRVNTQSEFNALPSDIELAISRGATTIDVELSPTTFYFKENHFKWSNKQWGGVAINMRGNSTVIKANGINLTDGQDYNRAFHHGYSYTFGDTLDVPLWGDLHEADDLIEVLDKDTKLCRLSYSGIDDQSEADCTNTYINITQWFKSSVYKVLRISDGMIYFIASDLAYNNSRQCYNVNLDEAYSRKALKIDEGLMPRFRLCNSSLDSDMLTGIRDGKIHLPQGITNVREHTVTTLLALTGSTVGSITFSGITFCGNRDNQDYLITFNKVDATDSIVFAHCQFRAIRSNIIQAVSSSNLRIHHCQFRDCYRYGIFASHSANTRITNCTFSNMGLALINTACIRCSGSDYYIAYNEFCNFARTGISLGTWWQSEKTTPETGVVEYNLLYFTPSYMASHLKRSLMDSGAIYLYTQNDRATVRHNIIHDYIGACDNNGIYCDDGACHFRIHDNIIANTPNGYSIDSRAVLHIATSKQSKTTVVNYDNQIYNNTVDGPIRTEAAPGDSKCRFYSNKRIKKRTKIDQLIQKSNIFAR